ncbi:hypothetical protein EWM64_g2587 [Hericium alpestre]|uniref:AB hydrolase-1 domain-containing protein n=1 Tax=Hericium alpestre TaxID=135208 RepID=A0A4Z0A3Y0_9AGAM|nr:hypothetical protein EWM64_g2587 [Hericium alpestre]
MVRRRCDIELPSGLKLEAIWTKPIFLPEEEHAVKLAVCLHPWSRLGGNMHDPVLESLQETLTVVHRFRVLRYNSRGVGQSSGSASFTGFAEAEDLQEVVQVAIQESGDVEEVLILGYSHGSLVASLHPVLPPPIRTMHVLLSYPLGPRGFLTLFNARTYEDRLEALLRDSRAHVLVVHGDADNFTGAPAYDQWADGLKAVVKQSLQETDTVIEHDRYCSSESATRSEQVLEACIKKARSASQLRISYQAFNGKQPGDPVKWMKPVVDFVHEEGVAEGRKVPDIA